MPWRVVRVVLLYSAVTLVMAWPFSAGITDHILSGGTDSELFMWTLAWDVHALTHAPWSIFHANIFHPHPYTLAFSENLIGSGILAAPIIWTTGDPQIAMNVVVLLATVLCAVGAYVLARRLGASEPAALLAGLVFGFAPSRFLRMDQVHVATIQWMPFALAYFHTYLDRGRARDLRIAVAFFSAQAVTSGHGAAFLVLAMVLVFVYRLALGAPFDVRRRLADLGWTGALLLLPAVLIYLPYRAAQSRYAESGLRRELDDWTLPASSFVTSPSHVQQWLVAQLPDWAWLRQPPDAWLFPGVLPLALAVVALVWRRSAGAEAPASTDARATGGGRVFRPGDHPDHRWFYAGLVLLTFWFAVGPPFGIWQLVHWMPGLSFVRVPSRFTLLGVLALAVLTAYGFDALTRRATGRGRTIAALVVGALLLVEFAAMPLDARPYRIDVPAIDRWLDTQPKPFVVAEIPVPDSLEVVRREQRTTRYMLHSTAHFQPIVHGYSGIQPPGYRDLYEQLIAFPDDRSLKTLHDLGVTYVVVHPDMWPPSDRPAAEDRFERFRDRLSLVHVEGIDRVYGILPPEGR